MRITDMKDAYIEAEEQLESEGRTNISPEDIHERAIDIWTSLIDYACDRDEER